jgi:adenylate cyclase
MAQQEFLMSSLLDKAGTTVEADDGVWPIRRRRILDWLVNETRGERFIDNILVEMCEKLLASGVPVARATLHFRTNHPQWIGARILWKEGLTEAKINTFAYGVENTPEFLKSPVNAIHQGAEEVRKQLEDTADGDEDSFYQELRDDGLTEYIAWPVEHTFGKRHVATFSTSRPGGFTNDHIDSLRDLLPALTLVSEIRLKNIMARTLLQTYVGPHASEQILSGVTTRGNHDLRSARLYGDFGSLAARRRHPSAQRLFRRYVRPDRALWRRDPEVHGRRLAGDLPAEQGNGLS